MKKYFLLTFILILADQFTKFLLQNKTIPLISFFNFIYAENTGAAFSMLQGFNLLFILISIVVLAVSVYYFKSYPLALSFLISGTIGNLLDRLVFGFVRDFISISIWPIFNLADSFNTIAIILLAYAFYKEDKAYKQKQPKKD